MNQDKLNILSGFFGVHTSYSDFGGNLVQTPVETQLAFLKANGLHLDNDAMLDEAIQDYVVAEQDRWFPRELITGTGFDYQCNFGLGAKWHIELDQALSEDVRSSISDNTLCGVADDHISLPPLPSGIHELVCEVGGRVETVTIITAPLRAPNIESLIGKSRVWGVNAPFYGLTSARNSGLGDFEDLARFSEYVRQIGGSFTGINPVHALGFTDPYAISPYSPSHRGFINTQHLALDGFSGLSKDLPQVKSLLQAVETQWIELRASEQVEYGKHRVCHNAALRDLYSLFLQHADASMKSALEEFRKSKGNYLERFALYEALSDYFGTNWHSWPTPYRDRDEDAICEAKERFASRIDFHIWLQWISSVQLSDTQNRASGENGLGLYLDLAVGARRGGAESWCEHESIAQGISLGAPPDQLGPDGQNWGLVAYAPKKLAANKYKSLRNIYRSAMQYAGVLRIDHVLGLNRSFWIPDGGLPGAYITQPLDVFLAILSIEASQSNTAVIGEDLGLVPDGFRDAVQSHGIYGYSVLQYEKWQDGRFKHPNELREFSLASFSTHDTPTLKGFISGCDIKWRDKIRGGESSTGMLEARQRDVAALATLDPDASTHDDLSYDHLFKTIHGTLANSEVAMLAVQLDDILAQEEAQNLPGTIDEHPNWRRKVPVSLEEMHQVPAFDDVSQIMAESGRNIELDPTRNR
nr:4-alpha-glucanotransferase [uncultured Cohaesibacter sp.]